MSTKKKKTNKKNIKKIIHVELPIELHDRIILVKCKNRRTITQTVQDLLTSALDELKVQ